MSPDVSRWLLALVAATVIAVAAHARHSLSRDGTIAAIVMGTLIVATAGWWAGLLLVVFFASSSILSRIGPNKTSIGQARGAERDAVQVFANGGVALLASIVFALSGNDAWILVLAGAIAAANADTWSTEIGRTSPSLPRLIITGRSVAAGTSGAVSGRGLLGAMLGGALIALVSSIGWNTSWLAGNIDVIHGIVAVSMGGFCGAIFDSLLGATVQDQRWCDSCNKVTEQRIHRCGCRTRSVRGVAWIDNDVVNLTCTIAGGVVALMTATVLM